MTPAPQLFGWSPDPSGVGPSGSHRHGVAGVKLAANAAAPTSPVNAAKDLLSDAPEASAFTCAPAIHVSCAARCTEAGQGPVATALRLEIHKGWGVQHLQAAVHPSLTPGEKHRVANVGNLAMAVPESGEFLDPVRVGMRLSPFTGERGGERGSRRIPPLRRCTKVAAA